ncbi:MAG: ABC transporter ATP-binding protein [bacterium]|nr:ABC transporter ATP-binding protein [bacterium]
MSTICIQTEQLCRSFVEGQTVRNVLVHVNLIIETGETVAIVGPSGIGKSTLLHILGLLDRPTSGTLYLFGKDTQTMKPMEVIQMRNKDLGFIFQFHHLLPEFTVLENLLMPIYISKGNIHWAKERAKHLLKHFGLESRINSSVAVLSGGEAQRVATIRALMNEPKIVFADEPTGNLDMHQGNLLMELLFDYIQAKQATLLIATHNINFANRCSKIIRLGSEQILTNKVT